MVDHAVGPQPRQPLPQRRLGQVVRRGVVELEEVDGLDAEAAEAHLAQCPRCTQLLQEMRAAVDFLPLSVPQVEPAPHLKGRILSAVQAVADASSQSTQNVPAVRPLRALPPRVPDPQRPTTPLPTPIRRRTAATQRWAMPVVAAAAVLFMVLSGGLATWGVSLQHQVASLQSNTVSLQHQVASLQSNAIATTTYAVTGTPNAPGATGEAEYIVGKGVNVTIMTVRGLPMLQNQQVYQGWLLQGKQTKSIGLLIPQADGTATINIPGNVRGNDLLAVSLEKGPTATPNAPKGKVLAVGKIL